MRITPNNCNDYSFKNRDKLSDEFSCYFCFRNGKVSDIEEWCDNEQTALCPYCSVDAVLPIKLSENQLMECHKKWFTGKNAKAD